MSRRACPRRLLLLIAFTAVGLACKRAQAWPPEPAPVVLGEDTCVACRMIVSDVRFGAELIRRDGAIEQFDDLGCLFERHRGESVDPEGVFVRAWPAGAWIRGDRAWMVSAREIGSPMGYGLAGFPDEPSARTEAARHPGASVLPLAPKLRDAALVSKGVD